MGSRILTFSCINFVKIRHVPFELTGVVASKTSSFTPCNITTSTTYSLNGILSIGQDNPRLWVVPNPLNAVESCHGRRVKTAVLG